MQVLKLLIVLKYVVFFPGQPDDRRVKNENCVYLNYIDNYFWHDDKCSENKTGYICEIGPLPPQQEGK